MFGFNIPGAGVILTLVIILLTGLLATNFIGQRLVIWWEKLLARIPGCQFNLQQRQASLRHALFLIRQRFPQSATGQYPRAGSWTIAFLTGKPGGDVLNHLKGDYVSVYVPTTPNPTSGFFLMLPRSEVIELEMDVNEALKYIVSMGVVAPPLRVNHRSSTTSNQHP